MCVFLCAGGRECIGGLRGARGQCPITSPLYHCILLRHGLLWNQLAKWGDQQVQDPLHSPHPHPQAQGTSSGPSCGCWDPNQGPHALASRNLLMTEPSLQSLAEDTSSGDCPKTDMALLSLQGRTSESQELLWIRQKDLGAKLKRFSPATHKTNPVLRRVKVVMDGNPSNLFRCSIRALEN